MNQIEQNPAAQKPQKGLTAFKTGFSVRLYRVLHVQRMAGMGEPILCITYDNGQQMLLRDDQMREAEEYFFG